MTIAAPRTTVEQLVGEALDRLPNWVLDALYAQAAGRFSDLAESRSTSPNGVGPKATEQRRLSGGL